MTSTAQTLHELDMIAQGTNPQQSPAIEEFQKCPDWQLAVLLLSKAIAHEQHFRKDAVIAAPAKWLPPQL